MDTLKLVLRCVLGIFLIAAGTMHFARPGPFVKIVPPYLPWPLTLVYLSGVAELLCGVGLLVPATTRWAAWGCVALFVAVFPANVTLYRHQELMPAPPLLHLLRC
jgi:uncharacterized membrane protein